MALTRSQQMSRIRGTDTKPELTLRKLLWRAGVRYRKHSRVGGCKPDLVFTRARVALFIDGCFWHGCPHHYVRPRTRREFWDAKLTGNRTRDRTVDMRLASLGWMTVHVWEHEVRDDADGAFRRVLATLSTRMLPKAGHRKPARAPP